MSTWDQTYYVHKPAQRLTTTKTKSELNAAARSGTIVDTQRNAKMANKAHHVDTDHRRIAHLDRSDDVKPPPKVDRSVGLAIMKARMDKGLTQKELAAKINEKDTVIRECEGARATKNQQVLAKLERVLGVKLRGKDIGSPMGPRGKKNTAA
ncbi:multiprotein-bridging factor 1 [Coemansia sp. RSA 1813]|nr:multiprotein-bridging factor 1 [Coemansia sp. RSA 1646]KAJ1769965.1 multiprotein-bridging factor 1 [Coemansia sp. RSA 1843]KAJ2087876.1 multiprotein-bridging factor 1 [Coemansia sp. RSA 986]KAJ2212769.1 multiprotein-bridging factor 1 [Coemansia sp. RSA 487]KAJ2567508.1 multiprotein-bridging factor 1 [Coemansia sp. RSA 1813]